MMMVVVMVVMLMRFMDVVYSVIIICLCCILFRVKDRALSQWIFNLITFWETLRSRFAPLYFHPITPNATRSGRLIRHNKNLWQYFTRPIFFNIVQQTVQHGGVPLLKTTKTLLQPVGHFLIVRDAKAR